MELEEIAKEFINDIQSELRSRNKVVTSKTLNSLKYSINESEESIDILFSWDFVLDIIDKGINGTDVNQGSPFSFSGNKKQIPIDSITPWMRSRGIPDNLKYPIAKSIYKTGYKGENFLDKIIEEYQEKLNAYLLEYYNDILNREITIIFNL